MSGSKEMSPNRLLSKPAVALVFFLSLWQGAALSASPHPSPVSLPEKETKAGDSGGAKSRKAGASAPAFSLEKHGEKRTPSALTTRVPSKPANADKILVPPPPPEIPLSPSLSHLTVMRGVTLEYLSCAEVQQMLSKIEKSLEKAHKDLASLDASVSEKKERIDQFSSLFKEGVVSRRELEAAKKEFADAQDEATESRERLAELEKDLSACEVRLKELKKQEVKPAGKKHR